MKWIFSILTLTFLGQSLNAAQDSLNINVQIDTIQSYTKDSCLTLLTVFKDNVVSSKRSAILTWYKVKYPKDYRKENGIKHKYGVNLEVINHGEKIDYLDNGNQRIEIYELGDLVSTKLLDKTGVELEEESKYGLQQDGTIKFNCSLDIIHVIIISEYGFPRRIRNRRVDNF